MDKDSKDRLYIFSVLQLFPMPVEVFSLDGTSLFVNQAFENFFQINREEIVGKLNILKDPYINHNLVLSDYLARVFIGEILSLYDLKVPFDEINIRYKTVEKDTVEGDIYQDIVCLPLRGEDDSLAYIIAVFMTKHKFQLNPHVMKAKEYIDINWNDDFNFDKIAKVIGMSRSHLAHQFTKSIGIPPYSYYQEVKIERIKEALANSNLSISQAFASCGVDYNSGFAEAFKKRVGMTPSKYKKSLHLQPSQRLNKTSNTTKQTKTRELSLPLQCDIDELLFKVAELFPIPIQIFEPKGDIIFINEATLKMWNVLDTSLILGKYNLLKDPLVNEKFGLRDEISRTFQGEPVLIQDVRLPLENFWKWYKTRSDVYDIEAIYTDIMNFPLWSIDGKLKHIVAIFFTSRIYSGRKDIAKIKEYLENHWIEKFDANKLSEHVHLSPSQLSRLFKKYTKMTPYSYYQDINIHHLKEAFRDKTLSIAEAFISCGYKYPGNSTRFFREKTGMTPSLYRKTTEE